MWIWLWFNPYLLFFVMFLAVIQGVAEFLPISSSGHLVLVSNLFTQQYNASNLNLQYDVTLTILLHAGTLFAVILYYARDVIRACFVTPRVGFLVILGSIPTAAIGFSIMKYAPQLETDLLLTGFLFIVTGLILITVMRRYSMSTEIDDYYDQIENSDGTEEDLSAPALKNEETMTWLDALIIGLAQGFAALPGLSRSGMTISVALWRHFDREWAAKFSFLLSIPVIGGGALLEIIKMYKWAPGDTIREKFFSHPFMTLYFFAAGVSFLVGWFSLSVLMRLLRDGNLYRFAWWLFIAGPATIAFWCRLNWETVSPYFMPIIAPVQSLIEYFQSVGFY